MRKHNWSKLTQRGGVEGVGDVFRCFKEWMKALCAANERSGLLEVEIAEDTDNAFACNYKYCGWDEIAKEFGNSSLCYPTFCYIDEAVFPRMGAEAGWQFKRTGTLATEAPMCDFRLERSIRAK